MERVERSRGRCGREARREAGREVLNRGGKMRVKTYVAGPSSGGSLNTTE